MRLLLGAWCANASIPPFAFFRRRKVEEERHQRIFDDKARVMGLDLPSITEQVCSLTWSGLEARIKLIFPQAAERRRQRELESAKHSADGVLGVSCAIFSSFDLYPLVAQEMIRQDKLIQILEARQAQAKAEQRMVLAQPRFQLFFTS